MPRSFFAKGASPTRPRNVQAGGYPCRVGVNRSTRHRPARHYLRRIIPAGPGRTSSPVSIRARPTCMLRRDHRARSGRRPSDLETADAISTPSTLAGLIRHARRISVPAYPYPRRSGVDQQHLPGAGREFTQSSRVSGIDTGTLPRRSLRALAGAGYSLSRESLRLS